MTSITSTSLADGRELIYFDDGESATVSRAKEPSTFEICRRAENQAKLGTTP
jgi:hypothetical protein